MMTATMATNTCTLTEAVGAACRILGYQKLTYEQEVAVKCIVKKQDVFVSLPTGSGMSLCYAILPLVHNCMKVITTSIVLVISPLISLIISLHKKHTLSGSISQARLGPRYDSRNEPVLVKSHDIYFRFIQESCSIMPLRPPFRLEGVVVWDRD